MNTIRRVALRVLTLLVAGAASTGCGLFLSSDVNDEEHCENYDDILGCLDGPQATIEITLTNSSQSDVHLFVVGESFPCCKVQAGGSRTRSQSLHRGGSLQFNAGRNGTHFPAETCKVPNAAWDAGSWHVSWNDGWNC
jgi:hypothetical protein